MLKKLSCLLVHKVRKEKENNRKNKNGDIFFSNVMRPSDIASISQRLGTVQHLGLLIYARVSSSF